MEADAEGQRGAAEVAYAAPRAAVARAVVVVGAWGNCAAAREMCGARSSVARGVVACVERPHELAPAALQLTAAVVVSKASSTALDVASSASTAPNSRRLRARGDPRPSERHLHHTSHPPKKINFPTSARPRVPTSIFALCRGPWTSGARARTAILSPASPPPEPHSQSLPPSFVLNIAPSSAKPASPVSLSQNQITKHNA